MIVILVMSHMYPVAPWYICDASRASHLSQSSQIPTAKFDILQRQPIATAKVLAAPRAHRRGGSPIAAWRYGEGRKTDGGSAASLNGLSVA